MKYKTYQVSAVWNQRDYKRNSASYITAKRNESDRIDIEGWWCKYKESRKEKCPTELIELKIEYLGSYSWFQTWFGHQTFGRFKDKEEAFASFSKFLRDELKADFGDYANEEIYRLNNDLKYENGKKICLMGAEQTWRWEYCECEGCLKHDKSIIKH